MSLIETLDQVLLQPLMQLLHQIFVPLNSGFVNPGQSLIALAILLNLLLLPLYFQMERNGRNTRKSQARVEQEVRRIKANFSGREAFYYVRTIYRIHNYSPFRVVLRSSDLLVQVLVFSTVYRYLSGAQELQGVAFGPIADLGQPDALLGGINLLPFVMTAVNLLSVFAYDAHKRTQGIVLSTVFLVLLYNSAAGLLVYWTASSLFSWARNAASRWLLPWMPKEIGVRAKRWVHQQ